jgi:arylsulfatase A-like enzyme
MKPISAYYLLLLLVFNFGCDQKQDSEKLPNIILINADDLGYGDLGCYGATKVQTPNIDKLAMDGRRFTDAHSASAVCSPSRYGLVTGKYPVKRNFWGPIFVFDELTIDPSETTIASVLKEANYATACIGKWHLGFGKNPVDWNKPLKPGPLELGFDYYYGVPVVNSHAPFIYVENDKVVGYDPKDPFVKGQRAATQKWPEKGGYSTIGGAKKAHLLYEDERVGTVLKDKALEWIDKTHKEQGKSPFFMYLATTNIHHPFTPAPQFQGTSEAGRYGDFIHELDWIVGEVVQKVEDLGLTDNTLVIFTSDNGGYLNGGGQDAWKAGHRVNGDLLGFKFGAWEGGHRIPFIAKWPGKIKKASKSSLLFSQIDLLATFAEITGIKLDDTQEDDSVNQLEALTGTPSENIRKELIISPNNPKHLVARMGDWVYIPTQNGGGFTDMHAGAASLNFTGFQNSDIQNGKVLEDAPPAQLYNLKDDLSQTTNLYNKYPLIVEKMKTMHDEYRSKVGPYPKLGWIAANH